MRYCSFGRSFENHKARLNKTKTARRTPVTSRTQSQPGGFVVVVVLVDRGAGRRLHCRCKGTEPPGGSWLRWHDVIRRFLRKPTATDSRSISCSQLSFAKKLQSLLRSRDGLLAESGVAKNHVLKRHVFHSHFHQHAITLGFVWAFHFVYQSTQGLRRLRSANANGIHFRAGRPTTQLAGPLQQAVARGEIVFRFIP